MRSGAPERARAEGGALPVLCVLLLLLPVANASAQGEAFAALVPTEFSAGLGSVIQSNPGNGSVDVNVGLSRAWVHDQWIESGS